MDPIRQEKLEELMLFLDNVDVVKEINYLDNLEKDIQIIREQAAAARDKWIALLQRMFPYKSELMDLAEIDTLSPSINLAVLSQFADFIDRHFDALANPPVMQPEDSAEDLIRFIGNSFLSYNPLNGDAPYSFSFYGGSVKGKSIMEVLQKAKIDLQVKIGFQVEKDEPVYFDECKDFADTEDFDDYNPDQVDFA